MSPRSPWHSSCLLDGGVGDRRNQALSPDRIDRSHLRRPSKRESTSSQDWRHSPVGRTSRIRERRPRHARAKPFRRREGVARTLRLEKCERINRKAKSATKWIHNESPTFSRYAVAGTTLGGLERHGNNPPHVDADRRQNALSADSACESLVERAVIRYGARFVDFRYAVSGFLVGGRVRLSGSSTARSREFGS